VGPEKRGQAAPVGGREEIAPLRFAEDVLKHQSVQLSTGHDPRSSSQSFTHRSRTAQDSPTRVTPSQDHRRLRLVTAFLPAPVHVREAITRWCSRVELDRLGHVQQGHQGLPALLGQIRIPELPRGPVFMRVQREDHPGGKPVRTTHSKSG
jgi:hypothetical protein